MCVTEESENKEDSRVMQSDVKEQGYDQSSTLLTPSYWKAGPYILTMYVCLRTRCSPPFAPTRELEAELELTILCADPRSTRVAESTSSTAKEATSMLPGCTSRCKKPHACICDRARKIRTPISTTTCNGTTGRNQEPPRAEEEAVAVNRRRTSSFSTSCSKDTPCCGEKRYALPLPPRQAHSVVR
jgi:hypothetical protein